MPDRTTIVLSVSVELDPVPGAFHTAQDAQDIIQRTLNNMIGHYNPTVTLVTQDIPLLNKEEKRLLRLADAMVLRREKEGLENL